MNIERRAMLRQLSMGAIAVGMGSFAGKAIAAPSNHRVQIIPPRNRHGPILRAQPPYRHTEHHYRKKHKRITHRHKPKLKARSLRAERTLNTPGNRHDLALTMWGEARGYGTLGMRCVGHVIMNRVREEKTRFGEGVGGVCHKRKQFSCWNKGDPNREQMFKLPAMSETNPDWIAFLKADKLAGDILAGIDKDNVAGATYYFAESMSPKPYWIDDMIIIGVQFGHMFCKLKPRSQRKKRRAHRHHHH